MGVIIMTWKKDLILFEVKPNEPNPYEGHFLIRNPFPGSGETGFDVCSDQEDIKQKFIEIIQGFSSETKRLRINGETGAGKTNILRYFERLTNEARRSKRITNLYPIYISDPGDSYYNIHGQIIDKLLESFRNEFFRIFQSDTVQIEELSLEVKTAREILQVLRAIIQPALFSFQEERKIDAFIRWLKGQKLLAADKILLTGDEIPPVDITSSSLAIRFLNGLLEVLKKMDLCDGVVLLFDEFEEIFEGLTRSRQSQYAQDLRHFFDTLNEFMFFVIATTPEPKDLGQYPAIARRIGPPLELKPIDSLEVAIEYVSDYLEMGRDNYEIDQKQDIHNRPESTNLKPLKEKDVEEEYNSLKEVIGKVEFKVLPGHFLPRMRERMRRTVENDS